LLVTAHEALSAGTDPLEGQSRLVWALEMAAARYGRPTPSPRRAPRTTDPAIGRAMSLVRDCLAADLTRPPALRELSELVGLSPYQLVRVFRSVTGFPPHAWLVQQRIRQARQLLDDGATLAAVTAAVGFADQAHLTRWFRRVVGVTPGAYRNSVQDARGVEH